MDVGFVVLAYLDRCERVGRQGRFSDLTQALAAAGASPEETFHGIRWLFTAEYAVRGRPDEFTLTMKGFDALADFRSSHLGEGLN